MEELRKGVRKQLQDIDDVLSETKRTRDFEDDVSLLRATIQQLDEPFTMVVFGQFNAGKSTSINAFVGAEVCKVGPVPTTDKITLLRDDDTLDAPPWFIAGGPNTTVVTNVDLKRLSGVFVIDTPGTATMNEKHTELAYRAMDRADVGIFVMGSAGVLKNSDVQLLQRMLAFGKKFVVVVNDQAPQADPNYTTNRAVVMKFVRQRVSEIFPGIQVPVFEINAERVKNTRLGKDTYVASPREMQAMRSFEDHIVKQLTAHSQVCTKLQSALGVGVALSEKYQAHVGNERRKLTADLATVQRVRNDLFNHGGNMRNMLDKSAQKFADVLTDAEEDAKAFVNEKVVWSNLRYLAGNTIADDMADTLGKALDSDLSRLARDVGTNAVEEEERFFKQEMEWMHKQFRANLEEAGPVAAVFRADSERLLHQLQEAVSGAVQKNKRRVHNDWLNLLVIQSSGFMLQLLAYSTGAATAGGVIAAIVQWLGGPALLKALTALAVKALAAMGWGAALAGPLGLALGAGVAAATYALAVAGFRSKILDSVGQQTEELRGNVHKLLQSAIGESHKQCSAEVEAALEVYTKGISGAERMHAEHSKALAVATKHMKSLQAKISAKAPHDGASGSR